MFQLAFSAVMLMSAPQVRCLGFGLIGRSQHQQDEAQAQEAVQVVRLVEATELANSVARGQTPLVHPLAYTQPQFTHPYNPHYFGRAQFPPHFGHQFYTLPPTYYFSQPQSRHYIYRVYNSRK